MWGWGGKRQRKEKERVEVEVECSTSAAATAATADMESPEPGTPAGGQAAAAPEEGGSASAADIEAASVRAKALYFDSLIEGRSQRLQQQQPAFGSGHTSFSGGGGGDTPMSDGSSGASTPTGSRAASPRQWASAPPAEARGGRYGSVAAMEALIESLQGQLVLKEAQRTAAADDARRKASECENLRLVVCELAASRAKAAQARASLSERYSELQREFHRTLRIADLSRTVSKENLAKSSRAQKALRAAQLELHATRRQASSLHDRARRVHGENAALQEKVNLLERLDFAEAQESVCMREFTRTRIAETY